MPRFAFVWLLVALSCASCGKHAIVDTVMASAYRPERASTVDVAPYVLLAGDLHCHVSPPDNPGHVGRNLPDTVALAEEEGLDFVVLSPHLWSGFLEDPSERAEALERTRTLARSIAGTDTDVMLIQGFEYSTYSGHATLAFTDLERVLGEIPLGDPEASGAFFERWVAAGGVIVVNHPLLTGLDSMIPNARWNLSWHTWTETSSPPSDIAAIDRLAHGWEAENSAVSHLRDYWMTGQSESSRRSVLYQIDRRIRKQRRRMTPIGGTDSHSHHIRAVTFVLAEERSERGVRDAIVDGRVCIRDPRACTFEARVPGGEWARVGAALDAESEVEVRANGHDIAVLRDGQIVARPRPGVPATVEVPAGECTVLRAHVDGGDSAPIYVDCPFAT